MYCDLCAYKNGFEAGQLDRKLGRRSEYAWITFPSDPEYKKDYSRGYHAGWGQDIR